MRIISGLSALGAGLFAASVAMAAEPPDLVGTWKATGEATASVHLGAANEHHDAYDEPTFGAADYAWTIIINEQKGRAFHGVAQSPKGVDEKIVGVVSFDGERLLISGDDAGLLGEVVGDKIEFCFQDHASERAAVACYVTAKQ